MRLPGPTLPHRHLQPGELLVTHDPQWVVTVLGSCVAVTMFNPRFGLASICHAMLPKFIGDDASASPENRFRYVSQVIPAMAKRFFQHGISPGEVEVKLFGGGNVIDLGGDPQRDRSIGGANVSLARELIESSCFRIKSESVGGIRGCKIVFNTQSGQVLHKRLSRGATRS